MSNYLKFNEAAEYTLAMLYLFEFEEADSFYSVPQILKGLGYDYSFNIVKDLCKHMESEMFIDAIFLPGILFARIASKGMANIESREDDFMRHAMQKREQIEKLKFDLNITQLDKTSKFSRIALNEEIEDIKNLIDEFAGGKSDLHKDLKIIQIELSKHRPDFTTIDEKLGFLASYSFLKIAAERLNSYLYY